jgi:hypothetical protein
MGTFIGYLGVIAILAGIVYLVVLRERSSKVDNAFNFIEAATNVFWVIVLRVVFWSAIFSFFPTWFALALLIVAIGVPVVGQMKNLFDSPFSGPLVGIEAVYHLLLGVALVGEAGWVLGALALALVLFLQYRQLLWLLL